MIYAIEAIILAVVSQLIYTAGEKAFRGFPKFMLSRKPKYMGWKDYVLRVRMNRL